MTQHLIELLFVGRVVVVGHVGARDDWQGIDAAPDRKRCGERAEQRSGARDPAHNGCDHHSGGGLGRANRHQDIVFDSRIVGVVEHLLQRAAQRAVSLFEDEGTPEAHIIMRTTLALYFGQGLEP